MDKLAAIFKRCADERRAALVIFAECGFPSLEQSEKNIEDAISSGADIIELGVPFSDPMADGAVIRQASGAALRNGVTPADVVELAARIAERHPQTGLILFGYMNVFLAYGYGKLCDRLQKIGADGILAVDLPFEEHPELLPFTRPRGLHLITLAAPTTSETRARAIMEQSSGFVYRINLNGVTGARCGATPTSGITELKKLGPLPVAAGFGVADPETAHIYAQAADAVVVGSAFVSECGKMDGNPKAFVAALAQAMKKD